MKRERDTMTDLSSDAIRAIVREIIASRGTEKEKVAKFEKVYPDFAMRYSVLFKLACAPDFDMPRLDYMLGLRDQITNNERTLENASVEVGQTLFDHYVKPIVPK